MKKLTKKEFKENCSFHLYTSTKEKHNVIYYDWKVTEDGRGFKYAIAARRELCTKKQLTDYFYQMVQNHDAVDMFPHYIRYMIRTDDRHRFRVPLALNF